MKNEYIINCKWLGCSTNGEDQIVHASTRPTECPTCGAGKSVINVWCEKFDAPENAKIISAQVHEQRAFARDVRANSLQRR